MRQSEPSRRLGRRDVAAVAVMTGLSLVVASSCIQSAEEERLGERPLPAPAAEHHLHIYSADGARIAFDPGETPVPAISAVEALAALDAASVERALVLSIAYMFGAPEIEVENERDLVRRENDYTAAQVATAPGRLVGACSVNPLAGYALEEIERCAADPRLSALKLHLANSSVDLSNEAHLERLAEVFRTLHRLGLPAVVHVRNREEGYGAADATAFIDRVLSQAPGLPVQIAHMGGWGGYDEATDAALSVFAEALKDGRLEPEWLAFDLAAVVLEPDAADEDVERKRIRNANRKLAERIRELGVERVVFATDWPDGAPLLGYEREIALNAQVIASALPLNSDELAAVYANLSPVLWYATRGVSERRRESGPGERERDPSRVNETEAK